MRSKKILILNRNIYSKILSCYFLAMLILVSFTGLLITTAEADPLAPNTNHLQVVSTTYNVTIGDTFYTNINLSIYVRTDNVIISNITFNSPNGAGYINYTSTAMGDLFNGGLWWTPDSNGTVSNAGGLGLIGAGSMHPDVFREHVQQCKAATDKPFGVNLPLLYPQMDEIVEIVLEEGVKIVFTSAGNPKKYTQFFKEKGMKVAHVVANVKFAMKCQEAGVDAVVAEGFEAGGHNGKEETTTMALIPQVCKAIDHCFIFPSRTIPGYDGFRPKGFLIMPNFPGNDIQGVIPRNSFPLAAPLGSDPANRMGQSVRVIDQLCGSDSF